MREITLTSRTTGYIWSFRAIDGRLEARDPGGDWIFPVPWALNGVAFNDDEVAQLKALIEESRLVRFTPDTLDRLADEIRAWQAKQFPHATALSAAKHLLKEAQELVAAPTDAEEIADIVHLVIAVASAAGVDLVQATREKFEKNKTRLWGVPDKDGVVEHVREQPPQVADQAVAKASLDGETKALRDLMVETYKGPVLAAFDLPERKRRIYIAGPMTGLPENNYPAFHAAAKAWREAGWDVVNPAEAFEGDQTLPYQQYVAHDVRVLQTCDAIALLPGWNSPTARGSVWECEIARDILHLSEYDATDPVPPGTGPRRMEPAPAPASLPNTFPLIPNAPVETSKPSNPKDLIGSTKLPLHLCPTTTVVAVSLAMLEGAVKYGRSNFRAVGVRASIYYDALKRHADAWFEGEDIDPDSGLDHLFKAQACLAVLIDAKYAGKLTDDRMVKGGYHKLVAEYTPHVERIKKQHADKSPKHYTIADNDTVAEG